MFDGFDMAYLRWMVLCLLLLGTTEIFILNLVRVIGEWSCSTVNNDLGGIYLLSYASDVLDWTCIRWMVFAAAW